MRFGPNGCVSTWLNDQARCMIKTECTEKDMDNYNFKFICVDESGEHVRHVFGKGSFDPEEKFDTLVTCTSCTADADDLFVSAQQRKDNDTQTPGPTSTNALLRQIVADVGELKADMANASRNVERLNKAVFKESIASSAAQETAPAPQETTPGPSSLVHRGAARRADKNVADQSHAIQPTLRAKGRVSAARMNAIKARAKTGRSHIHKIRRRHTEDDVDAADQGDAQDRNDARVDNDAQDGNIMQSEEDARGQDDSEGQDDSRDQDDARYQDEAQEQDDDDADRRDQTDARDADADDDQRDDVHDSRDDDRYTDSDRDGDDREADDDGHHEESDDQ